MHTFFSLQNYKLLSLEGASFGFPHSSVGKKSTCNAGDLGSIPGWGRSTRAGIGYPLQYSWSSLMAQLVKNPPVMWETWVRSLAWENPLEKGKATHSSTLAWRIPWTIQFMGSQRVRHDWATFTFLKIFHGIMPCLIKSQVLNMYLWPSIFLFVIEHIYMNTNQNVSQFLSSLFLFYNCVTENLPSI